jgi:hypothetical protein
VTRFEVGHWQAEVVQQAILQHNLDVQTRWLKAGGDPLRSCWWHVTEITADHLRPSPEWMRQMAELELAKKCEAEIRNGLRLLEKKKRAQAEQKKIFDEVAATWKAGKGQP